MPPVADHRDNVRADRRSAAVPQSPTHQGGTAFTGVREWTVVDAGGTTTVVCGPGTRTEHGPVTPASVGHAAADDQLHAIFSAGADEDAGRSWWFATAALDPSAPATEVQRIARVAARARLRKPVIVTDDVSTLLLLGTHPGDGAGTGAVAVVSGTGSGIRAGHSDRVPISVGSQEYLASDEGSAFALGRSGLRAAVRARDGRAPDTALLERLEARAGGTVEQLARRVAAAAFPKATVAALADVITQAWSDGDLVAGQIVERAVDELAHCAFTGARRAGLGPGWRPVLAGGVFRGCPAYAAALAGRLVQRGALPARVVADPSSEFASWLKDQADPVPNLWAGKALWIVGPDGGSR